jgi:hypothetical protein
MNVQTDIVLEDGRTFTVRLWSDPAREGLWFADVDSLRRPGDNAVVGPFGGESGAREYLFARVERELGMICEVRRLPTIDGGRAPALCHP